MNRIHPLKELVTSQKRGQPRGIYSACSANEYVLEACLERALATGDYVLIEATANQVNQFGGYTGMNPADFHQFVLELARKIGFPLAKIILGGDHLGPLTWKKEPAASAMAKSRELIRAYVLAGFTKIHLDTSMRVGDDDASQPLATPVIAERGAELCRAAEEAFAELRKSQPQALAPVYVIGSEVPIPGGSQEEEDGVRVTTVADLEATVRAFQQAFLQQGLATAWDNVIAVVVQPGVEFGDDAVHDYNRQAAKELTAALQHFPQLVFEGHSTDYQTPLALRQMVEDGIAILKVGPALTFALHEGLFALSQIENELFRYRPDVQASNFMETLEAAMLRNPDNWRHHYHGDAAKIRFARKFSLSDRQRYYLPDPEVRAAISRLMQNLRAVEIPLSLISHCLPLQYAKIRVGQLANQPEALLKDRVVNCVDDYLFACHPSPATTGE